MSKVAQDDLRAFGIAVKRARVLMGWNLKRLGAEIDPPTGSSFISRVETGQKDNLGALSAGRFIRALDLEEAWIDCFLGAATADDGEETKAEKDADRIVNRLEREGKTENASEALLIQLANTYAEGTHRDLETAYIGVRNALDAAERIRLRGEMPNDNTGSQLNAVLAEVAKLNAEGELDQADTLLDDEERRMREFHKTEKDRMEQQATALLDRRLDQDRLRNDPAAAADRLIADLKRRAPPGGVFWATRDLRLEWDERGSTQGDPFELRVALVLANRDFKGAKGPNVAPALLDLANSRFAIGRRNSDMSLLRGAEQACRAALKLTNKSGGNNSKSPHQNSLGNILLALGERNADEGMLEEAVNAFEATLPGQSEGEFPDARAALRGGLGNALQALGMFTEDPEILNRSEAEYRTALTVQTEKDYPSDWALSKNNLGVTLKSIGKLARDEGAMSKARDEYQAALTEKSWADAPFKWAQTQWNLGDLELAWFDLDGDPAHLDAAHDHVMAARDVFAEGSDYQTERCDELLAKIAEARATLDML